MTYNQVKQAVNSYHGWRDKIDMGRVQVFEPLPSVPKFAVGNWLGTEFQDAAANSGEDIYNSVLVEGTGPDGAPLRLRRWAAQQDWAKQYAALLSSPIFANPSFATDVSNWTIAGQATTFTRDTTTFDTSPASGKVAIGNTATLTGTISGTFLVDEGLHLVQVRLKHDGSGQISPARLRLLSGGNVLSESVVDLTTSFATYGLAYLPAADTSSVTFELQTQSQGSNWWIDSCAIYSVKPTLADRAGFVRSLILEIGSAITETEALVLGDAFLSLHRTTPFKGTLTVTRGGVRRLLGGANVHPGHLLREGGELIRFTHRIDPDTGGLGRDGRIASIEYDSDSETATVAIDNDNANFEALLARLDVTTPTS
jgi:hypothetical protein